MSIQDKIRKALEWRYAVKRFDSQKKISAEDWTILADSLVKSPSSYGLQPWKFMVIENQALREELKPLSWNQSQITDASHLVVILAKEKITAHDVHTYMARVAAVREIADDKLRGFRESLLKGVVEGMPAENMAAWNQRQTYIAMGFLLETAALLEIDSCPIEGISIPDYDRVLKVTGTGYSTIAVVALGYRHAEDHSQKNKKVRFDHSHVLEYRK